MFTNRERKLETLEFYLEEFLNGVKENVCIFGLRRIGKTILIREFVKRHREIKSIYLNFEFLFSVPIELSENFILESAKWFFDKELEIYDLVALSGGEVVKKLLRELEKGESSKTAVIKLAFEYLRVLGKEEKIGASGSRPILSPLINQFTIFTPFSDNFCYSYLKPFCTHL